MIAVNQDWGGSRGRRVRDDGDRGLGKPMSGRDSRRRAAESLLNERAGSRHSVGRSICRIPRRTSSMISGPSRSSLFKTGTRPRFRARGVMLRVSANHGSAINLSDVGWASMTNGWGPVERDRSNGELGVADGGTLTIERRALRKGLGVHAHSDVRMLFNGQCSTLEAIIGIDDEVGSRGSVVFQVLVDGVARHTSGVMTGATPPPSRCW